MTTTPNSDTAITELQAGLSGERIRFTVTQELIDRGWAGTQCPVAQALGPGWNVMVDAHHSKRGAFRLSRRVNRWTTAFDHAVSTNSPRPAPFTGEVYR